jgi:hypothetical protein
MFQWLRKFALYLMPTSMAGRAATSSFFFLMIIVAAGTLSYGLAGDRKWLLGPSQPLRTLTVVVLMPMISGLVYAIVRFWGEEDESLFPDIDRAWTAGIRALDNVGISLSQGTEPLFLILGSGSVEAAFVEQMQASGHEFRVKGVPGGVGEAPSLRWYATDGAIFLFVSDVGALATLARDWMKCSHDEHIDWDQSLIVGQLTGQPRAAVVGSHMVRTIDGMDIEDDSGFESSVRAPAPLRPASKVIRLPMEVDFAQQYGRICHLSRLIRHARHPRCGLNGLAVLMPFELTVASGRELGGMVQAIRRDLHAIHGTLQLRFPVFGLVTGMEQAVGFNEFASQLGREKSLEARLGSGFSVYSWATGERLQWLSDRICDAFEDFTYGLFAQSDALAAPDENCKLYHLLCRVRQRIKPQLNQVLAPAFKNSGGLGSEKASSQEEARSAVYFGGCYLAATGSTVEEGQAFVTGVLFKKLKEHEHNVEWTEKALNAQKRFKALVWLGWIVLGVLSVLLIWRVSYLIKLM